MKDCECGLTPTVKGSRGWWMAVCECGLCGFGNAKPNGAEKNWDKGLIDRHGIIQVKDIEGEDES